MKTYQPSQSGQTNFHHYSDKYKCCCQTVHVKQGTWMIGLVSAVLTVFGLLSTLFAAETITWKVLELLYLALELLTVVLLFVGISKKRKCFLLPFQVYQIISALLCVVFAIGCIFILIDPTSALGKLIQESIMSEAEMELEKLNPQIKRTMMVRLAASFLFTLFALSFAVNAWFIMTVHSCYKYLADVEKHAEVPVTFNTTTAKATVY